MNLVEEVKKAIAESLNFSKKIQIQMPDYELKQEFTSRLPKFRDGKVFVTVKRQDWEIVGMKIQDHGTFKLAIFQTHTAEMRQADYADFSRREEIEKKALAEYRKERGLDIHKTDCIEYK